MRIRWIASALVAVALMPAASQAKKKPAPAPAAVEQAPPPRPAGPETMRAIEKLMGKFRWGMAIEDALKIVTGDIEVRFDERIKAERDPFKQDKIRKEMQGELDRARDGAVKFDGHRTGWDVSLIDKEFAHANDEAMLVIWEKDQRRFLFFYKDKLWKQFIAFNADHPKFAGKSFDDFGDIIQAVYGPASVTFRKQRTSEEQTFDHLEWVLPGDYQLWAIDMTQLYNNFCLSLMQKTVWPEIEKGRAAHPAQADSASSLVDQVVKPSTMQGDENVDIVDEITGRQALRTNQGAQPDKDKDKSAKKKGGKK